MRIMREIKFRAWEEDVEFMNYSVCITTTENKSYYEVSEGFGLIEINPEHVMQYTGLKDKNGTEIYEGDIYDTGARKFIVKYDNERAGYYPFAKGDGCGCCSDEVVWIPDHGEVIGNIYENPELLEKEQSK